MKHVFSTHGLRPRDGFRRWREVIHERIVPVELTRLGDRPFGGTLESADIGSLTATRVSQSAIRTEATPDTIRRHDKHHSLTVSIVLEGIVASSQNDREAIQRAGEIVVLDRRPTVMVTEAESRCLLIEVPRSRLEQMLGPARLYTALTIGSDQASTSLVTTFLNELVRLQPQLNADEAERMSAIGVDLLVAGIAKRIAQEVPTPLHGTVVVQRAKAYVEANLHDPTLDPEQVAGAVGVSLRRLQQLFKERERHVSDWIWQRRLERASQRLADPRCGHLPIGTLAYDCGFISQAHFSRRFKDRFGVTPSEMRHQMRIKTLSI